MRIRDMSDEKLLREAEPREARDFAAEVIRLRGYQREAAHEMVQAAANLRNLTAMCEQHIAERDQLAAELADMCEEKERQYARAEQAESQVAALREALGSVRAGVWDRLYAKGPLSTERAQAISKEVDAALASSAAAAEAHDAGLHDEAYSEATAICLECIEGTRGYQPMASSLAIRDAKTRQAALEEAIARFEERPPMPANQFRHEWAVDVLRALVKGETP